MSLAVLRLAVIIFGAAMLCPSARAVMFVAFNFQIQIPDDWRPANPVPSRLIASYFKPDKSGFIAFGAAALPAAEREIGIGEALEGASNSIARQRRMIFPGKTVTIGGVPFRYFTARGISGCSGETCAAVAGKELHVIDLGQKTGDVSTNSGLHSILQSFQLLAPGKIPPVAGVPCFIPSVKVIAMAMIWEGGFFD